MDGVLRLTYYKYLYVTIIAFFIAIFFSGIAAAFADTHMKAVSEDEAKVLYSKYGDAVYQVQVVDLASGEKTSIGSAFQISESGLLATNYHVIAEKIHHPKKNRIDFLSDKKARGALEILYVDVINDLAILRMEKAGSKHLSLANKKAAKGSKMFSIGNPHDIGFTIIEGTYNGIAKDSFIDKIHFSGSLNSGMSGGPAIDHKGQVVGVNVATAGNQISFLVPVAKLSKLLEKVEALPEGYKFIENADEEIQKQLLARQNRDIDSILTSDWQSANFAGLQVPGKVSDKLKCWGGANHKEKDKYEYYYSMCSGQDRIFVDRKFYTGAIAYRYNNYKAKLGANPMQFYSFYEKQYRRPMGEFKNAREDNVTKFKCNSSNLKIADDNWKSSLCVRRYKKYPKLHDMHLYMAKLGDKLEGVTTAVIAQGVSEENILKLSEKFIAEINNAKEEEAK